ncbi:MAG: carbohydrate ABC transporter permease [Clostridiales bacterium]|nr:carbohydrate ABC transporter permease [Clostridiales bacterium]
MFEKKDHEQNSCDIRYPSLRDKVFYAINGFFCILFGLIVLIPLVHVVASSFSQPAMVNQGKVFLWPVNFTTIGYERVFTYPNLWNSYKNTIINTLAGTTLNLVMTICTAYPLSVKTLPFRKGLTTYFIMTMYISAGIVPIYLVIKSLGLINTWWVMIIPMAMNCSNVIIMRTFFQGIPSELQEAAMLDGCSHFQYLYKIVLPLSVTAISVIGMFYAVEHWNRYFEAIMYLNDSKLYTLQVLLRTILTLDNVDITAVMDPQVLAELTGLSDLLKYSVIVVSTVPILCLYPLLQKYYVKGIMLGSVKG